MQQKDSRCCHKDSNDWLTKNNQAAHPLSPGYRSKSRAPPSRSRSPIKRKGKSGKTKRTISVFYPNKIHLDHHPALRRTSLRRLARASPAPAPRSSSSAPRSKTAAFRELEDLPLEGSRRRRQASRHLSSFSVRFFGAFVVLAGGGWGWAGKLRIAESSFLPRFLPSAI